MTIDSQLSTTEPKTQKQKQTKQTTRTQNYRNGDHMEDYQQRGRGGKIGEKVQGIGSIFGRYKIDRGRFRTV